MTGRIHHRVGRVFRWVRQHRLVTAVSVVTLLGGAVACESTNTYPLDFFTEMHYQKSYRTHEPARLGAPEGIVPIEGRAPLYGQQEAAGLENPLPASDEIVQRGEGIYVQNCIMCHGPEAEGNGVMAGYFTAADAPAPADLTQQRLVDAPDGYLYSVAVHGFGQYMPPFGNLIPGDDIWALVQYIRTLQQ